MTARSSRFAVVASTGGGVLGVLLGNPFFSRHVLAVLSDRECGAVALARRHGKPAIVLPARSAEGFCDALLERLERERIDWVISFFTRLFTGALLGRYADRIINLHPSLLPSFKGLHGFEDAVARGVRFVGTTIHLVDERMDEGRILLQTVLPLDPDADPAHVRHELFGQQCRSLLQVMRWLVDDRVEITPKGVRVRGARYDDPEFSPALDFVDAIALPLGPYPGRHVPDEECA